MNAREKEIIEFALRHLQDIETQLELDMAYTKYLEARNDWSGTPPDFEEITQTACYVACVTPRRCVGDHE